ncbi:MAG: hypothetical protein LBD52_04895 [Prevotellaceae bacterium]|jgi:hypothetical protein|nr:hypothetical protein [Prevotellaceae bacterium]
MRKILHFIAGLVLAGSALVACFDAKDFEFEKFTLSDLAPTLYIPLVNDTVRLDVSGDYNVLYDKEGMGYLHFDIENNILPPVEDFFTVPANVSIPVNNASINLDFTTGSDFSTSVQYSCSYTFPRPDQQIDSIIFKSGTFTVAITAPSSAAGSYTLTIPGLTKDNVGFSEIIPFGNTSFNRDLSGYTLKFEDNNAFNATIGVTILAASSAGQYNFSLISFSNVKMKEVHGYFGQPEESPDPVSVDISTFDKFRNTDNTNLRIKEAFLDFTVENGAGFPIQLRIDEVTSTSGGVAKTKAKVDSVTIRPNEPGQSYLRSDLVIGGDTLGKVLSNMPSEMELKFSATINPEGRKNGTVKNFLTDASSITVSNISARIPLNFSVSDMVLRDTLDFNSSKMTFQDMELLMNIENSMPVEVVLQAYLMDENDNVNPTPLFKTPVSIPAATVDGTTGRVTAPYPYEEKIEANVEGLAQTKKLKVEITVNSSTTTTSQYVRVTKDNYIYLKMGAKAKVNIDKID